mgnify:CR=1 FL=1
MEVFIGTVIIILFLYFAGFILWKATFVDWKKAHTDKKALSLKFMQVKLPQKLSDLDQKNDPIQNMKQNIDVMNQIYKNFYAIYSDDKRDIKLWQDTISLEIIVEKELIKFVMGIPDDYFDNFEKIISSFYPGAVIDIIDQPKMLDAGKFMAGWYFSLTKKNPLPFKTYENFEADPMDSMLSSFSRVESDEKLSFQILVSPISEDTQKQLKKDAEKLKKDEKSESWLLSFIGSIGNLLLKGADWKNKDDKKEEKNKYSGSQNNDIDKKLEDELFSVKITALALSPLPDRPEKIINDLGRSLNQYNYVGLNSLQYKKTKNISSFIQEFIKRTLFIDRGFKENILDEWKETILSIKELSSLFHLPHSRYNKNPRIKRQNYKIIPAPDSIPNEWLLLGHNLFAGVKKEIRLKNDDRFRHFYIIWQTGTGKSTMLLVQARADVRQWNWFCLIDPHGDLCEDILKDFPKERIDDLIYFDAANFEYPLWFNVFETVHGTEDERDIIVNDLVDMFVAMYGHEIFGPRIQDYFRNAALALMEQPDWGTLTEIVRIFVDPAYQKLKIKNVTNPVVRGWWDKTYASMGEREKGEMIPYFQAKFGPFTTTPIIRNIIWQPKTAFNMAQAMQEKKIILVNLSKGKLWEVNSQLLGRMITTQVKLAALARSKMLSNDRVPFFLYIDEFQNYVSSSIESILSEARKYKLWLIVAHQYIDQLKQGWLGGSLDLSKAIFGNVGSMMAYKVGAPDAEFLEKEFSPEISQSDLVNMDKFKAIMKLSVDTQPTRPFSIAPVNPFSTPVLNSEEKVAIIKQISALKRWTKKDLAEKEIFYRVGI